MEPKAMYAFAGLGGFAAGAIAGGLTAFFQLFAFVGLYFGMRSIFTGLPANPTASQALLFNLSVYAILALVIFCRRVFREAEGSRSSAFFSSFILTFPLPAIWLAYAWQSHGASI